MKRSRLDIINDMLMAIQQKGGRILPTHLLFKSNLSHKRMKTYVNELLEKGLVVEGEHKKKKYYELTDDGRNFLEKYKQMNAFTQAFGL